MMLLLVFSRCVPLFAIPCTVMLSVATTKVDTLPGAFSRLSQLPVSQLRARAPIIVSSCLASSAWKVSGSIPRTVKYVACYNGFVLT